MKLASWITANNLTMAEAARRFDVAHTTVARWCSGALFPGLANLIVIRAVTEGQVGADDFMPVAAAVRPHPAPPAQVGRAGVGA